MSNTLVIGKHYIRLDLSAPDAPNFYVAPEIESDFTEWLRHIGLNAERVEYDAITHLTKYRCPPWNRKQPHDDQEDGN